MIQCCASCVGATVLAFVAVGGGGEGRRDLMDVGAITTLGALLHCKCEIDYPYLMFFSLPIFAFEDLGKM